MPIVYWSNEYSIGNEEIDHQHEHIINLVNALEIADTSGDGAATADLVLTHLLRYMAKHFAEEEQLMKDVGYPGLEEHQRQHGACSCKLAQFVSQVASGEMNAAECVPFIRQWLHTHMLESDQRYAAWVRTEPQAVATWAKRLHRHSHQFAAV
jgi:hemerythrin